MKNIYLPIDDLSDFACYSVYNADTIRAYYNMPAVNSTSDYVDFYIFNHYLEKSGSQSWGSYTYNLPTCLPTSQITTDFYYRTDLCESLLIFISLVLIIFWIPLKLTFFRLFRRLN